LGNFNFIKSCFGPEDDEDEKFEIKHKKERKVSYHPYDPNKRTNKKKNKKGRKNFSEGKDEVKHFNSSYNLIPMKIDVSQYKLEEKEYDMEYDRGCVEYKLKLCDVNLERIKGLTTQMNFRLNEGNGECDYYIGVEDNGNALGISNEELDITTSVINTIAINLGCTTKVQKVVKGQEGLIAEMHIKKQDQNLNKLEINVGVLGEEGTGKSTLIGVLINGKLDNGKGFARRGVFRHKHEVICGKTSSFSHQILGFDEKGELTNYGNMSTASLGQIVNKSTKIINFYDMAGSTKTFNRTTLTTLSNEYLDYLLFVVSAKEVMTKKTEDLLLFIYNINLPIITIINKIDLISEEELKKVINKYQEIVLNSGKILKIIKNDEDIALFSPMEEKDFLLAFLVSNLTWDGGLTLFKNFLAVLPQHRNKEEIDINLENMEFDVLEVYNKEKMTILWGIVSSGKMIINSGYYLGPDSNGNFKVVEVTDIHCKSINVDYVYKGQYCSVCIKSLGEINTLTKDNAKKGMILLDLKHIPIASRLFEIEIWTIDNTTKTIKTSYQPILNIKHIRQGVKIKNPNEIFLFLSDNKNCNELENLVMDNNVNLDNINENLHTLMDKKNKINGKIKNDKNENKNQNIKENKNENKNENIKENKNEYKIENNINDIFEFKDEITIGPYDKRIKLTVEFLFNPEYITVGQKISIYDQSLKAWGIITKIFK
jgi:elongation factor 1-alpha